MAKRAAKRKSGASGARPKKNTVMVPVIAPAGTERSNEGAARVGAPSQGAVSDNPIGNPVAGTPPGWEPPTRHAPTGPALAQDEPVLVVWEKGKGRSGHEGKLSEIRRLAEKRKETGEIYKGTESIGKVYPNGTVETWHRYASNPIGGAAVANNPAEGSCDVAPSPDRSRRFEENPRRAEPAIGALVRFDLRGATSPMYEGREYHQTMVFRGSVRGGNRLEMPDGHEFFSTLPIIEVSRWGPGPRRSEAYYRGDKTGERASDRPVGRHGERLSGEELHRSGLLDVGHRHRSVDENPRFRREYIVVTEREGQRYEVRVHAANKEQAAKKLVLHPGERILSIYYAG